MKNQWKLLYKSIARMADLVGIVLLIIAILFALRGF
jgi:hypothetical protein